ncbi:hypothetical protein SY83_08755 [Paenibacillus swuensis]|uniref:Lipoprotein n=1 Tax=Paenibacillus swuensis TaxID=1178515 RepID=A0A172THI9_9BACL|nr:hypothetical protein [Paenibacillus swuensis]ANE46354.1 hypothetical protein SY83_08755 [Paenibacillus swuensis]
MKRKEAYKLSIHMALAGVLALSLAACSNEPMQGKPAGQPTNETNQETNQNQQTPPEESKSASMSAEGIYNGLIDNHTVEIDQDGAPQAYQLEENVKATVDTLSEKAKVSFDYYELTTKAEDGSEVKQLFITSIKAVGTSAGEGEATVPGENESGVKEPLPQTKDLTVNLEGSQETIKGTLSESTNGYVMYTLPGYILTSEEPGRDVLYAEADDQYMTRIEDLGANPDFEEIRKLAEAELKEVGDVVESNAQIGEGSLKEPKIMLHATNNKLTKDVFVIQIEGNWYKFTMDIPAGERAESFQPSVLSMIGTMTSK